MSDIPVANGRAQTSSFAVIQKMSRASVWARTIWFRLVSATTQKSDLVAALLGQGMVALGLLVGLRIQTEHIPPEVFGQTALLMGYAAVCLGLVSAPYLQASLRYYPEMRRQNEEVALKNFVTRIIFSRLSWLLGVSVLIGWGICSFLDVSPVLLILVTVVCWTDVYRGIELAFLNAARAQRKYFGWTIYESWARPLLAVLFVVIFGARPEFVLAGYAAASLLGVVAYRAGEVTLCKSSSRGDLRLDPKFELEVREYARPLYPLGLVAIVGSLSDRYVVGGLIGLSEAGLYAAISGLISRPFIMIQSAIELAFRPRYFEAIAARNEASSARVYRSWILANTIAALMLTCACIRFENQIASSLLSSTYSSGQSLIPYLAGAQFFVASTYVLNGYLYAHKLTREIFKINAVYALISCLALLVAGSLGGLMEIVRALLAVNVFLFLSTGTIVAFRHLLRS